VTWAYSALGFLGLTQAHGEDDGYGCSWRALLFTPRVYYVTLFLGKKTKIPLSREEPERHDKVMRVPNYEPLLSIKL